MSETTDIQRAAIEIAKLTVATELSPNSILITDIDGNIEYVNECFLEVTGYSREEVIGKNPRILQSGETPRETYIAMWAKLAGGESWRGELINKRKDGSEYIESIHIAPVRQADGRITHYVATTEDITGKRESEARLEYLHFFDQLTGLANRTRISDLIDYACALSRREARSVTAMLVDLDRFRLINDSLGSVQGDEVLKQVAVRLRAAIRESDTLGRIGGNEFVLVLYSLGAVEDAVLVAKKIQGVLSSPFVVEGHTLHLTASIGIAMSPDDGETGVELLRSAATALHTAKEDGRNQYRFFQQDMNQRAQSGMLLESGLYQALEKQEFELFYQPKVDLRSGNICGLEALLRWRHPARGLISPAEFVPVLEDNGLIVPVGEWVIRTACKQAKSWQVAGIPSLCVSVNLSAVQFHRLELCRLVQEILEQVGLEPEYLELEITESTIMKDVDRAVSTLRDLKSLGVKLSVDDFGTGHSSLNYLKRFATDVLKIDKSFVHDIATNAEDALIGRAIIDLAHNLGLKVIAEGVETKAQLAFMYRHNCDEIQGYYFSKPLPVADCTALLREARRLERPDAGRERTLLLVDDEQSILSSLKRLLRRDGYHILTAADAEQGFALLLENSIGVIISDHRMPGMSGTEFLGKVKELYPDTIRIVLSGYADFQFIADAINRGAIYKFLTKPWDDELLREQIKKAFDLFDLRAERNRLTAEVRETNRKLADAKLALERRVKIKTLEAQRNLNFLQISQEILEELPFGVIGIGDDGLIAVANKFANRQFFDAAAGPLQGSAAAERLPVKLMNFLHGYDANAYLKLDLGGAQDVEVFCHRIDGMSHTSGTVLVVAQGV